MTTIQGIGGTTYGGTTAVDDTSNSNYIPSGDDDSSQQTSDVVDLGNNVDSGINDMWNQMTDEGNFVDEKPMDFNGTQYQWNQLNSEKMTHLYKRMMGLANLRLFMSMLMDQKSDILSNLNKINIETDLSDITNKTSSVDNITKANQKLMKSVSKASEILTKKVNDHNEKVYNDALKSIDMGTGCSNTGNSNGDKISGLKQKEKLQNAYKAVCEENLKSLNNAIGSGFQGANASIQNKGQEVFAKLGNADDYITFDKDGYIDLAKSKQWVTDLRSQLKALANMNTFSASIMSQKETSMKAMQKVLSDKGLSLTERMGGLEEAVGESNSLQMTQFDRISSEKLKIQSSRNEIKKTHVELEKTQASRWFKIFAEIGELFAAIIAVAAIICLSIVTFGTAAVVGAAVMAGCGAAILPLLIAGVAVSVTSACLTYGGAELENSMREDYNPTLKTFQDLNITHKSKNSKGQTTNILEKSDDLEAKERELMNSIGMDQISELSDGHYAVDKQAVEKLQYRLTGIQNMERFVAKMLKGAGSSRKALARALSGIDSGRDSGALATATEEITKNSSTLFGALTSNLNEWKTAQNWMIDEDRAIESARIQFGVSLGLSVVGACLGGIGGVAGALLGATIGQMLGSAIAGVITTHMYDTGNSSFSPKPSPKVGQTTGKYNNGTFDGMVNDINADVLGLSSTIDAGDGNIGINTTKIVALQSQLQAVFTAMSNILTFSESKANTLKATVQSLGGVVSEGSSSQDVMRALFESEMQVFNDNVQMIQEEVEVSNRANSANQATEQAWTKFGVTVGLLAVAGGVAVAAPSVFQLCLAVTNLALTTVDFAYSVLRAKNDYGDLKATVKSYEQEDDKKIDRSKTTTRSHEAQILDRLDALQQQALNSINESLIQNIGSGNWGVNMGESQIASSKLESLNRIKEMITEMHSQMGQLIASTRRSMGAVAVNTSGNLEMANFINSTMTNAMVQTKMQGLQQIASRHNQISEAGRQEIMTGVNMAYSAVQVAISAASFGVGQTGGGSDASKAIQKTLSYVCAGLSMCQSITDVIMSYTVKTDRTSHIEDKSSKNAAQQKDSNSAKSNKSAEKGSTSSALSVGDAGDSWEQQSLSDSISMGDSQLQMEFNDLQRQRSFEQMNAIKSMVKTICSEVMSVLKEVHASSTSATGVKDSADLKTAQVHQQQTLEKLPAAAAAGANVPAAIDKLGKALITSEGSSSPAANTQAQLNAINESIRMVTEGMDHLNNAENAALKSAGDTEAAIDHITERHPNDDQSHAPDDNHKTIAQLTQSHDEAVASRTKALTTVTTPDGQQMPIQDYLASKQKEDPEYKPSKDPVLTKFMDKAQEVAKQVKAQSSALIDDIQDSKAMTTLAELSDVGGEAKATKAVEENFNKLLKEKGKPLKELSAKELNDLYRQMRTDIFVKAKDQLAKIRLDKMGMLKEKGDLQKQRAALETSLKTNENPNKRKELLELNTKIDILDAQISEKTSQEGPIQQEIKAFNKQVGAIDRLYFEKTKEADGVGKHLEAPKDDPTPKATTVVAPAETDLTGAPAQADPTSGVAGAQAMGTGPAVLPTISDEARANQPLDSMTSGTGAPENTSNTGSLDGGKAKADEAKTNKLHAQAHKHADQEHMKGAGNTKNVSANELAASLKSWDNVERLINAFASNFNAVANQIAKANTQAEQAQSVGANNGKP